jgi:mannose-6-phosphate isomerase-like protein (cupin superfamily)
MEFIRAGDVRTLSNPGVTSLQLLSPHNSKSSRVTITRVTVEPGASQPPHAHQSSEQIWVALAGSGILLLANGETRPIFTGEVVRFADGDIHGFRNTEIEPFVYLSVTAPPIDFRYAYRDAR